MYYRNKGHPIERDDHVFDFMAYTLGILIIMICMATLFTIGWEFLKMFWGIYLSVCETLRVTIFVITKKIDSNILLKEN